MPCHLWKNWHLRETGLSTDSAGMQIAPQSPGILYCSVYVLLNLLLLYHDCDPWQPGVLLRAWEEITASLSVSQPAKHQFSLIQRAQTKASNRTVVDQSQAGEGRFCPLNKVTGKTVLQCSSSTPPSVGKEKCVGWMMLRMTQFIIYIIYYQVVL